ncbi:MAG TPA: hypothetical protein VH637_00330 [Streptosporangiaceae bacterium]
MLGADFPSGRRAEAGFHDLACRIGPGFSFLQTRPPTERPGQGAAGDRYVGPWVEGIARDRHQVAAVLGYRYGSAYAAAIAEGISHRQPMPAVILFDPQLATIEFLGLEFSREIGAVSSLLADDEIERARKAAEEICRPATSDIAQAAAEIVESYFEVITAAFERAGLGDARSNKFAIAFESYISWLSAADQIDPGPAWEWSTVIASSGYPGLPAAACAAGDDGRPGRMIRFDVGHADLLRSEDVAEAVLALLQSRS